MKKLVPIAVVLVAVAATAWFVWSRAGAGGAVPAAAALDSETTVGALGVDPVEMWRSTSSLLEALPGLAVDNAELQLLTPGAVKARLGFDPGTVEGWAGVGLDSKAGVTFAVDARAFGPGGAGLPVVLLRVTDREKFLAFLGKSTGEPVKLADAVGETHVLSLGEARILWGERRGLTVLALPMGGDALTAQRPLFEAFLKEGGTPLVRDEAWRTAFDDARGPLSSWLFLGARGGQVFEKSLGLPAEIDVAVEHYVKLFPGFATWNWFAGEPGGMLVTSPEAMRALEQIFRPRKSAPKFTQYMPAKTGFAFRWSVNLVEVTGGIAGMLPPNVPPQARMALEMGKALLPMQVGVSWTEMTDALSGHFAVAIDVSKVSAADRDTLAAAGVALIGVQTAEKADAFLVKVAAAAKDKLEWETSAVDINGAKGFHLGSPAEGITLVRKDDVIIGGVHEAVDSAVRGTAGLRDTNARCLDDDVAFATWWNAGQVLELVEKSELPQAKAVVKMMRSQLADAQGQAVEGRLVANGMRFSGVGGAGMGGATSALGLVAALALPAFDRYQSRSTSAEARVNLERMARGAQLYYNEQKVDRDGNVQPLQFPGAGVTITAPEDWHARVCVDGRPVLYTSDAETFSHPVFKSLNFTVEQPSAYQYQFVSEGTESGARFTARAFGDLDCDGVFSTFEKTGSIGSDGHVVLAPGIFERDAAE